MTNSQSPLYDMSSFYEGVRAHAAEERARHEAHDAKRAQEEAERRACLALTLRQTVEAFRNK